MKRSIKSMIGFSIEATDGDIGTVKDFYFEDNSWIVRYLIVGTGGWLDGRKVLISPDAHLTPDWSSKVFSASLTKEQVKSSPNIDTELPVYRQQEIKLYDHYSLGDYWRGGFVAGGIPLPMDEAMMKQDEQISERVTGDDLHLRSMEKVIDYEVKATDGTVGTVKDFIVDDNSWGIKYIVVNTGYWFSGKNLLLSPDTIKEIKWDVSEVVVDIDTSQVKSCPEFERNEMWMI